MQQYKNYKGPANEQATQKHRGLMSAADKGKLDGIVVGGTTDANGWVSAYNLAGKRVWQCTVKVTSGFPVASAWGSMFTLNLPVGISTLGQVYVRYSYRANTWARVLLCSYDATDASSTIVMNGTLVDGGNFSARGFSEICFDFECVEK